MSNKELIKELLDFNMRENVEIIIDGTIYDVGKVALSISGEAIRIVCNKKEEDAKDVSWLEEQK